MSGANGQPTRVTVTIDGRTVEVAPGTLLVEAARQAGVHIPVFCYHPKLKPVGVCRMCLVKVERMPKLVPACTTPVTDGMVVDTRDPEVRQMQQAVLEFLLINHPLDCPVCDKGGECELQDLTFKYGPATSRLADAKVKRRKAVELGPFIVLDEERCILCRRCVRFDDEVAAESKLVVSERAIDTLITTADGQPYDHYFTGNTIELCPVGALTSRVYRFRARPWDLSPVASYCTLCSVHCPVRLDFRHGQLMRVVSQGAPEERIFGTPGMMAAYRTPAEEVPGFRGMGWLCDRGRFDYRYLHSPHRPDGPLAGRGALKQALSWDEALNRVRRALEEAVRTHGPGSVAIVGGGRLMAEEAWLLRQLADALGTPHRDHRVSDQAVASLASPSGRTGSADALERARLVVLVGQPLVEQAPVLDLAVRRAAQSGAAIYATGPVRPRYPGRVQTRQAVGAGLADALRAWKAELVRAVAEAPGAVACVLWDGRGAWDGTAAVVGEAVLELAQALESAGAEVHVLVPGDQAQSRAAEAAGVLPGPDGLDTAGILRRAADGGIQVLYLVGANLLETFPDRSLVERALERTPFVVVQDLFVTATATMADLVLPALPSAMRAGTLVDLDGVTHRLEAALPPDGRGRADGEILAALLASVRADGRREEGPAWGDRVAALSAGDARRLWGAARQASAADKAARPSDAPDVGLRVVPLVRLYGGGGTVAFDPAFAPHRERLAVWLHPADAERLGVVSGAEIELRTAHGAIRAPARIDPAMAEGLAGVPLAAAQGGAAQVTAWDDPHPAVTSLVVRAEVVEQRS
ncbi:MAG TPA: molybdopterin-dependent oxidoreductase [Limnochordales bacterium]